MVKACLACVLGAVLFASSASSGDDQMIERKVQTIQATVTVGMNQSDVEAALARLKVRYQFFSLSALMGLYGVHWGEENPKLHGRLVGRMPAVSKHLIGETDLSIEVDIGDGDRVSAVRVTPVHVGP